MALATIFGGIFGLSIAWVMNYFATMRDNRHHAREMAEIEEIRKSYRKAR